MSKSNLAIIHLRDFIEKVGPDPTCPDQTHILQIQASLNIPSVKPEEQSDDINVCPIPALIRFFTPAGRADLYQQDVFVYVRGPFHVANHLRGQPKIMINAYTVDW
jgi:hypothetical protein